MTSENDHQTKAETVCNLAETDSNTEIDNNLAKTKVYTGGIFTLTTREGKQECRLMDSDKEDQDKSEEDEEDQQSDQSVNNDEDKDDGDEEDREFNNRNEYDNYNKFTTCDHLIAKYIRLNVVKYVVKYGDKEHAMLDLNIFLYDAGCEYYGTFDDIEGKIGSISDHIKRGNFKFKFLSDDKGNEVEFVDGKVDDANIKDEGEFIIGTEQNPIHTFVLQCTNMAVSVQLHYLAILNKLYNTDSTISEVYEMTGSAECKFE
jgi:hypothetical protein